MRRGYGKIAIFAENDLRDYLEVRKSSVIQSIENEQDDYIATYHLFLIEKIWGSTTLVNLQ